MEAIFHPYLFGTEERQRLDRDGYLVLPSILTDVARVRLIASLSAIQAPGLPEAERARQFAAEHDPYLASLIGHPQLLYLARQVLGAGIRFDHCVVLNRPPGDHGTSWHSHGYAEDRPELGFLRIFLYVNGFTDDDGGLGVVPGSHLHRDPRVGLRSPRMKTRSDEELRLGWLAGKRHPISGEALEIRYLSAPAGTVILMWTYTVHGVSRRQRGSDTRWTVVYAYRSPGAESRARMISEGFERQPPEGAEGLLSLY